MPKLKVLDTRQTTEEIVVMSWSPKMDLLALGNITGSYVYSYFTEKPEVNNLYLKFPKFKNVVVLLSFCPQNVLKSAMLGVFRGECLMFRKLTLITFSQDTERCRIKYYRPNTFK